MLAILFDAVVITILAALVAGVLSHGDPDPAQEPEGDERSWRGMCVTCGGLPAPEA